MTGRFHLSVKDKDGNIAYLYIHPSTTWKPTETEAFVELLSIVGEERHNCPRENIWFADLQNAQLIKPGKSWKDCRRKLKSTMAHYERFTAKSDVTFDFDAE